MASRRSNWERAGALTRPRGKQSLMGEVRGMVDAVGTCLLPFSQADARPIHTYLING